MDENKEIIEGAVEKPTARQELETLLNEALPEEKQTGDVEQMALDYIREMKDMNGRLVEAMSSDPRMAQVFAEVIDGGKAAQALIRHFGRRFFDVEEGTPEYEEMMAADAEYQQGIKDMEMNKAAFDEKARNFFVALDDYCNRMNLNADVYKVRIVDEVLTPALDWVATDDFFGKLVNAVDYDKDVEDAFEAGKVKGRNMNINEMRGKIDDGMPKGLNSQGTPVIEKPKRIANPLIARALNA